ncbi:alpha/beta hydrolase family esterase [Adhaeribacter aquaticus]|uniref:alpha/beta hydrolase family esterase n=1 Tax=Adhaeribacter aquaticus TaxID=299567 RepID=UPI00040429B1|nr:poly(3-hydroxybutyrate) depolymerase [Adhaeribacter aquaticus]
MKLITLAITILLSAFAIKSQAAIISDSVKIGTHYRAFHFNQPSQAKSGASLIFVLHGSGGTGMSMMDKAVKLEQKSATENILLVYPDGYKKYWNECRRTAQSIANKENIDENAFFAAMITYFQDKYQINKKQVFAIGTSGGGHMTYKLALTMPQEFRAITAIIANLPTPDNLDCGEANIPVPVMIINGTNDEINPYMGGVVIANNVNFGEVRSTENTLQYWAKLAGYTGNPIKSNLPDKDLGDGKTIEQYTYKKKGSPEVTLLKVNGGKHDYPNDIDVYEEAWSFFKRQIQNQRR